MPDLPHLRAPLRMDGTHLAVIEQDSDQDILQSVEALLRTPEGSRAELPDYGVPDLPFRSDTGEIAREILDAIREHEPRTEAMADAEIEDMIATVEVDLA